MIRISHFLGVLRIHCPIDRNASGRELYEDLVEKTTRAEEDAASVDFSFLYRSLPLSNVAPLLSLLPETSCFSVCSVMKTAHVSISVHGASSMTLFSFID